MDMLNGQKLLRKNGEVVAADEALKDKKIICYFLSPRFIKASMYIFYYGQ